jgi:anti-anti-sigma factor
VELQLAEELFSDKGLVLTLTGRLDAVTVPGLKSRLKGLIDSGRIQVIVDLTDVSFIDSSGLSALVSGLKAARQAGGTLKLAGLNEQTRTAFRLTMLDRVFEFYPDASSALDTVSDS